MCQLCTIATALAARASPVRQESLVFDLSQFAATVEAKSFEAKLFPEQIQARETLPSTQGSQP